MAILLLMACAILEAKSFSSRSGSSRSFSSPSRSSVSKPSVSPSRVSNPRPATKTTSNTTKTTNVNSSKTTNVNRTTIINNNTNVNRSSGGGMGLMDYIILDSIVNKPRATHTTETVYVEKAPVVHQEVVRTEVVETGKTYVSIGNFLLGLAMFLLFVVVLCFIF